MTQGLLPSAAVLGCGFSLHPCPWAAPCALCLCVREKEKEKEAVRSTVLHCCARQRHRLKAIAIRYKPNVTGSCVTYVTHKLMPHGLGGEAQPGAWLAARCVLVVRVRARAKRALGRRYLFI